MGQEAGGKAVTGLCFERGYAMAGYGKKGGFLGNMAKLGGSKRKLKLTGDTREENMTNPSFKKAPKQAHKRV